jgi:hypothetical protein
MAAVIHFEKAVEIGSKQNAYDDTTFYAAPFDGELTEAEAVAAVAAKFPPKSLWLGASITTRFDRIDNGKIVFAHRYPIGD